MDKLLLRPSPFGVESGSLALGEFEAGEDLKEMLAEAKVLVVGAGRWVNGWVSWVKEEEAVRMRCCGLLGGGWVGGWVGGEIGEF